MTNKKDITMKYTPDFSSRFRILKGGKISLVVSTLIVSSAILLPTSVKATTLYVTSPFTGSYTLPDNYGLLVDSSITSSGVTGVNVGNNTATPFASGNDIIIGTNGQISSAQYGLYVYGMDTGTRIISNGVINAINTNSSTTFTAGIDIVNSIYGTIRNSDYGTIIAESPGGLVYGVHMESGMEQGSTFTNLNRIQATAVDGIALGVSNNGSAMHGSIENGPVGTITAQSSGGAAYGVFIGQGGMDQYGSITNLGIIQATSQTDNAMGIIVDDPLMTGIITNYAGGVISGESNSGNAYGVKFNYDIQNGGSLTNNGTIQANSLSGMGYGIYSAFNQTGSSIINNGTIEAKINGVLDRNGYSLFIADGQDAAAISNEATGKLNGNIYVYNGTFTNNGLISLPHNANGSSSAYISNFHQTATGTLEIGLYNDGTVNNNTPVISHSQLNTNTATFDNGSKINVNVLSVSANQGMLAGQRINDVVKATNTLTVGNTINVTDNSALLNFQLIRDGNSIDAGDTTIDLLVVAASSNAASSNSDGNIHNISKLGGANATTLSAAKALDTASGNAAMTNYITALNTLGTDAEVAHAVATTTPIAANASVTANTQIMNGVQGIVEMRQNSVMGGSMNSGDMSLSDKNLWVKLYGSKGTQDNKDGINGFDVKAYGLGFGADAEISPKQRIGAAFFYTDAKVDVNDMPQSSKLKVYTAMLYGNVPMNANTDFLYQAGYTWQKTESERTVLPTYDHAKADYTATTASLDLKVMQTYKMNEAMDVRPLIEGTYRYFTNPSYSESGAGTMNLQTDKFTSSQLITSAGAIIDYKLDKTSKLVTDLRLGYDWHHDAQTVTASYQGASGVDFTTNGIDNGGWQYDIGLGYETTKVLGGELNFMYNYQGQGSSFNNHVLSAKYVYKF